MNAVEKKNNNVATIRTGVNLAWAAALLWAINYFFGVDWSMDDPVVIAAIPIVSTVVYRISVLASRVNWLGFLLFGINEPPKYPGVILDPPPPGPNDGGEISLELVIVVVAICVIVVAVYAAFIA